MANPTTNYGFVLPVPTDLVTDLPADFEVALQGVDTQMKTNADAAIAKTIVTTKGDLIAATGTSTPARVAVGSNGQLLAADSTAAAGVAWVAAPSGGGMTLLSTTSLSGTSTTISSINQTYTNLFILLQGGTISSTSGITMQVNSSSGGSEVSRFDAAAGSGANSTDGRLNSDNAQTNFNAGLTLFNYANTSYFKSGSFIFTYGAGNGGGSFGAYNYESTTAVSSIRIGTTGGTATFSAGQVLIYGVK